MGSMVGLPPTNPLQKMVGATSDQPLPGIELNSDERALYEQALEADAELVQSKSETYAKALRIGCGLKAVKTAFERKHDLSTRSGLNAWGKYLHENLPLQLSKQDRSIVLLCWEHNDEIQVWLTEMENSQPGYRAKHNNPYVVYDHWLRAKGLRQPRQKKTKTNGNGETTPPPTPSRTPPTTNQG